PEGMLVPALEHRRLVLFDRREHIRRIEAGIERAPPRFEDCRSEPCSRSGRKLEGERAAGKQTLPALLQLASARQRIRLRSATQPLRRHVLLDLTPSHAGVIFA